MSSSSVSGSSTSSSGGTLFNGTSRFSSDFQNIITRSVAIAKLPITQLTSESTAFAGQSSELGTLGKKFTAVQTAIQQLQSAVASGSVAGSVSDPTVAQVELGTGANPATFTLQVKSLGSYTNTISAQGQTLLTNPATDALSTSSSFTLTVNGTDTTITPAANTLDSLVSAINANSSLGVQASVVNVGSSSSPDYRLSLQSNKLGPDTIQLNDGSADLLSNISAGTLATYQVDGLNTDITSTSRTVTLAPGVTVSLLGQSATDTSTTITVATNTSSIQTALGQFVSSFNAASSEVTVNQGSSGGALQGQSIVYQLQSALRNLGSYSSGSSSISSLTSLGITFDKTGKLSLDTSVFASATAGQLQSLTTFLGDSSKSGFLQFATTSLANIADADTGLIATTNVSVQTQTLHITDQISTETERVNILQKNLQNQLAASDALVAELEQSYNLIAGIFQAQTNSNNSSK